MARSPWAATLGDSKALAQRRRPEPSARALPPAPATAPAWLGSCGDSTFGSGVPLPCDASQFEAPAVRPSAPRSVTDDALHQRCAPRRPGNGCTMRGGVIRSRPCPPMSAQAPPIPAARPARASCPRTSASTRVRAKLGEGATSEVFLAHDDFHQRDVAIKRVRSGLALDTPEGHFQQHFFAAEAALVGPAAAPERGADLRRGGRRRGHLPGDGVRRRRHAAALLPRRRAAVAGAGGRDRLQVRDGAGLRLPPGADPPRRQAGQHPGRRCATGWSPTSRSPTSAAS